jgi:hypothetical protein
MKNKDWPTIWGSVGITDGGKIGLTGTLTAFKNGEFLTGTEINYGVGLPIGPIPMSGAIGVSNTYIVHDWNN